MVCHEYLYLRNHQSCKRGCNFSTLVAVILHQALKNIHILCTYYLLHIVAFLDIFSCAFYGSIFQKYPNQDDETSTILQLGY